LLALRNSGPADVEARARDVERLIAALGTEGPEDQEAGATAVESAAAEDEEARA
jgi:hypothetical protein